MTSDAPLAVIEAVKEPEFQQNVEVVGNGITLSEEELLLKAEFELKEAQREQEELIIRAETVKDDPILEARIEIAERFVDDFTERLEEKEIEMGVEVEVVRAEYQAEVNERLDALKPAPIVVPVPNPIRTFTDVLGKSFYDTFLAPLRQGTDFLGKVIYDTVSDPERTFGILGDVLGNSTQAFTSGLFGGLLGEDFKVKLIAIIVVIVIILILIVAIKTAIKAKIK